MKNNLIRKIELGQEKIKGEKEKLRLLESFLHYEGRDEVITSKEAWKELEEARRKPAVRFLSKIPKFDNILDGFREGELVILSGLTKQGKTTFAQTLTTNFAQQNIPCLWFSYEVPQEQFLTKFKVPTPYFLLPRNLISNNLDWIKTRIIEGIAKYGIKIVFIDHLHYLLDMPTLAKGGNVSLIIGGLMREFKKVALEWKICIVIIAHTKKLDFDMEPHFSDIRDSSFIVQESDLVLMIWRLKDKHTKEYKNEAKLVVQANRRTGNTGTVYLAFKDNQFYEKAKE